MIKSMFGYTGAGLMAMTDVYDYDRHIYSYYVYILGLLHGLKEKLW